MLGPASPPAPLQVRKRPRRSALPCQRCLRRYQRGQGFPLDCEFPGGVRNCSKYRPCTLLACDSHILIILAYCSKNNRAGEKGCRPVSTALSMRVACY